MIYKQFSSFSKFKMYNVHCTFNGYLSESIFRNDILEGY